MTKKIIHVIVFLIVASIVISSFSGSEEGDDGSALMQLPALLLGGMYAGIMFVMYVLPAMTDRATHAVLDSNEMVEKDPLHDARAAYARGDYEEAMKVYRSSMEADPYNRLPWVEVAKIQHDNLENPEAAILTLRQALESHEWPINDAAYFMGRLADIYWEDKQDAESAITILKQMTEMFPETRHFANATHKINDIMRTHDSSGATATPTFNTPAVPTPSAARPQVPTPRI